MSSIASATNVAFSPKQRQVAAGTARFPFAISILDRDGDKSTAFALRARAYSASGIALSDDSGLFQDTADDSANAVIMLAHDGHRLVGTLRANFSHPEQPLGTLACAPYFPALQRLKETASGALVEIGRMAIEPDITNTSYRTTLYAALVRAGYIAALAGRASNVLVTTKASWVGFYEKMLGFQAVGAPALYPPGDIPITLLVGSMATAARRQKIQNAFFRISPDEVASMRVAIQPTLMTRQEAA